MSLSLFGITFVTSSSIRVKDRHVKEANAYAEVQRAAAQKEREERAKLQTQLHDVHANVIALQRAINADYNSGRVPPKKKTELRKRVTDLLTSLQESLKKA